MNYQLYHGDCLEIMPQLIAQGVKVDAIICDPPFGTTSCDWDSVIPFAPMWENIKRLIMPRGAVVLFGSEPFSSLLRVSNLDWFKYDWVWDKKSKAGFLHAKNMPMKRHEQIMVFSGGIIEHVSKTKNRLNYNPQMESGKPYVKNSIKNDNSEHRLMRPSMDANRLCVSDGDRYPSSIIEISNAVQVGKMHPTQKPVELMSYLVKTYTQPGETVLDFTFGSCSTGIACLETGRNFIGIEKDPEYFRVGKERMEKREKELIEVGAIPLSYDKIGKDKSGYQVRSLFEYQQILEMGLHDEQK